MLETTATFRQLAAGYVRPLSWRTRASFTKAYNSSTKFFTLNSSVLDGTDILGATGDNVLQSWDKYEYSTFTDRVISIEITREETEPYSIVKAYADITFNNYDNYFTPNSGSPIDAYILPRRPFMASLGFGNLVLRQIVGLSDKMPELDKNSRTATFHVIDFMDYLMSQDISESVLMTDVKTHEVLEYLLQLMGLTSSQYELDGSVNTIAVFSVDKGTTFGEVASKLMEAEIGALYLTETGVVRFKNRYNYSLIPVYSFDKSNTIDYSISDQSTLINSVRVKGEVRTVQAVQSVATASATQVRAGESVDIWLTFNDPVTTVVNPIYSATAISSSYFTTTTTETGGTPYTDISLTTLDLFSKSAKLTFTNTGASNAFVYAVDLYGTPAQVSRTVDVSKVDETSIDKYEEQYYEIDNEYIQSTSNAESKALILLNDYADYANTIDLEVKGTPALQTGDAVTLDLDGYQGTYMILKTANLMTDSKYTQRLRVVKKQVITFFTLNVSVLNGTDLIGI